LDYILFWSWILDCWQFFWFWVIFTVTAVDSGSKALEFLGLNGENELRDSKPASVSPDPYHQHIEINMIITDYCMPGMTGYDLLKKIKVINLIVLQGINLFLSNWPYARNLTMWLHIFFRNLNISRTSQLWSCPQRMSHQESTGEATQIDDFFPISSHFKDETWNI